MSQLPVPREDDLPASDLRFIYQHELLRKRRFRQTWTRVGAVMASVVLGAAVIMWMMGIPVWPFLAVSLIAGIAGPLLSIRMAKLTALASGSGPASGGLWSSGQVRSVAPDHVIWPALQAVAASRRLQWAQLDDHTARASTEVQHFAPNLSLLIEVGPSIELPGTALVSIAAEPRSMLASNDFGTATDHVNALLRGVPAQSAELLAGPHDRFRSDVHDRHTAD